MGVNAYDGQRDIDRRDLTLRNVSVRAESLDEENRSVEAVVSTEREVSVFDWCNGREIQEILRADGAEFPEQVPLLANHSRYALSDVLGSVRNLEVNDGTVTGRLYFDDDEDSERAFRKVKNKHLTDVSVGYRVLKYTEVPPGKTLDIGGKSYTAGEQRLRVATRWQIREVSLVPIGADQAAKIRQQGPDPRSVNMDRRLRQYLESLGLRSEATDGEAWQYFAQRSAAEQSRGLALAGMRADEMDDEDDEESSDEDREDDESSDDEEDREDDEMDDEDERSDTARAERQRVMSIRRLAGNDTPNTLVDRAISEGWDSGRAAAAFLRDFRRRTAGGQAARRHDTGDGPAIHSRSRERDVNVRSLACGLLASQGIDPTQHRFNDGKGTARSLGPRFTDQDAERGDMLRSLPAIDVCREAVYLETGRRIRDPDEAIRSAVSGSTLTSVFTTNMYARLIQGYERIGDTTAGWCDEEDVPNFLQQEDISLSADARLTRLPRGDEAKHASMSDRKETYKIARYAKQFIVDEQDIIDDRLGAIMRMPEEMGENARQLRPDMVYALMLENPTLVQDGKAVFSADHANTITTALSSAGLKAAISKMVKQRENDRQLNLRPRFLIVPAELEWTARELTDSAMLAKLFADSSDPFYSQLNLLSQEGMRTVIDDRIGATGVIDPRTGDVRTGSDTQYFLGMGGPRSIRVAYRRGTGRAPQMRSFRLERGRWGVGWDINHDIGVAFMDFRPWVRSTGAAS